MVSVATCAVPPTLGKAFSPATIAQGGRSTLTLTLSNSASAPATLSPPLVDNLPNGVKVAGYGSNTCGGGLLCQHFARWHLANL